VNNSTTREVCVGRKKTGAKIQSGLRRVFWGGKPFVFRVRKGDSYPYLTLESTRREGKLLPNSNFEQADSLTHLPHFADANG